MRNVVVGVDGTEAAGNALAWAVDAVGPDGSVHAILALDPVAEYFVDVVTGDVEEFQKRLEQEFVTEWTSAARDMAGLLTASVAEMSATTALKIAGEELEVDAIVVGAHAIHFGLPRRIGTTVRNLLGKLPCPLVVVPSTANAGFDPEQPIVVGVGHGAATAAAVRWAAHVADDDRSTVALVHATGDPPMFEADGVRDLLHRYTHRGTDGSRVDDMVRWAEEVQGASENELDIRTAEPSGLSAVRLAEASEVASLLVVGLHRPRRGLGWHTSQPLRYALTHARCPVAVVPHHSDSHGEESTGDGADD